MPSFEGGPSYRTPFGKNVYLRSTQDVKTISKTFAASTCPEETIDGVTCKILQPGSVIAKITSGPEAGKVGPYRAAGDDEVQTITKSGTIGGGTFTLTVFGVTTTAIAYNAIAADVQAALRAAAIQATDPALAALGAYIEVTGGPVPSTAFTVTFNGQVGANVAALTADAASLTGSTPGLTIATSTAGTAGATDGRQTTANIVGVNDTFLPTQLLHRDVEIAVVYEAAIVQASCREVSAAGAWMALGNTTATAIKAMTNPKLTIF